MELYIKNRSFETIGVIDQYTSLIWTRRYWAHGDFELYIPADNRLLDILQIDNYVCREDDVTVMIIEKIQISTDAEDGNFFIVSGRSAESILYRRVITRNTWNSNAPSLLCTSLISHEFMNTSGDANRVVSEFKALSNLTGNEELVDISHQNYGATVYDAVFGICKQFGMSMKITYESDLNGFKVSVWRGRDRTYSQTQNSQVIFSPEFDNLVNSEYVIDYTTLKTEALCAGEENQIFQWRFAGLRNTYGLSGITRRETYVDAGDISQTDDNGNVMTYAEYQRLLSARADESLADQRISSGFTGEIESNIQFVYKRDWDLGDIVQIANEYGITGQARVLEVIESDDESGHRITPTFSEWEVCCCD